MTPKAYLMIVRAFVPAVLALITLGSQILRAQEPRDAMILFSYWPKSGQEAAFHDGYRKHLDWHRANDDPILWYAWDVIVGKRTGLFIDGAFDIPFSDLDNRVKPGEDAADFVETAAAFAETNDRVLYQLRTELSSDTALEDREPAAMVEVIQYRITPGGQAAFEAMLSRAKEEARFTCYEIVAGGQSPGFLVLIQRSSFKEIGAGKRPVTLTAHGVVESQETEVWRYRSDLTYFPKQTNGD